MLAFNLELEARLPTRLARGHLQCSCAAAAFLICDTGGATGWELMVSSSSEALAWLQRQILRGTQDLLQRRQPRQPSTRIVFCRDVGRVKESKVTRLRRMRGDLYAKDIQNGTRRGVPLWTLSCDTHAREQCLPDDVTDANTLK